MTTEAVPRPFHQTHRTLKAEEVYILTVFDAHKGLDPLKHSSAEARMRPITYDESFLMDSGYLVDGTGAGGRKIKGTARISVEGRQAIGHHMAPALRDLAKRRSDKDIGDRQRELFDLLLERLKKLKGQYEEDAEDLEPETPRARTAGPVKRRDAKGKRIPLSKAVRGKGAEPEEDGDGDEGTPPPSRSKTKVAAPAAPPRKRR